MKLSILLVCGLMFSNFGLAQEKDESAGHPCHKIKKACHEAYKDKKEAKACFVGFKEGKKDPKVTTVTDADVAACKAIKAEKKAEKKDK